MEVVGHDLIINIKAPVSDEIAEDCEIPLDDNDSEARTKVLGQEKSVTKTDVKALKFSIHSILGMSGEASTQDVSTDRKYSDIRNSEYIPSDKRNATCVTR